LCHWFHISYKEGIAEDTKISNNDDVGEEEIVDEQTLLTTNNQDDTTEEEDENIPPDVPEPSWYTFIQEIIEHVNKISQKLCKHPGWILALDEMLRKLMGCSAQTIEMKLKPNKEDTSSTLYVV
jgi:hypothetical protein